MPYKRKKISMIRKTLKLLLFLFLVQNLFSQTKEVLPSIVQQEWADKEIGVLIHFDMPVFKPEYVWNRDFGKHPDASIFNPTALDTDQWVRTAKAAGAKYVVLVAKHCSGFSLWPTEAHEYSIRHSPWKNGKGDIVKDFIASCRRYGIEPGLYASTGANGFLEVANPAVTLANNPQRKEWYNTIVKKQLTELYTNYGPLFEIWFDGGVLPVDKGGFDILSMLKKRQPKAIAFQGPFGYENNIRWVGNEEGLAPYPCWSRADSTTSANGIVEISGLNGNPNGAFWCPGEADFPLRRTNTFQGGWFWHQGDDEKLFSLDELLDKYTKSVGRNTNMLLGMVVDNRGLVPDADVKRMTEFGKAIKEKFSNPIAKTKGRGNHFELTFTTARNISSVIIMEDISKGDRIVEYRVLGKQEDNSWVSLTKGSNVGHKRIEKISGKFKALKLEIIKSSSRPFIRDFSCY